MLKNVTVRVPELVYGLFVCGVGTTFMTKSISSMPPQLLTPEKCHDLVQLTINNVGTLTYNNTGMNSQRTEGRNVHVFASLLY